VTLSDVSKSRPVETSDLQADESDPRVILNSNASQGQNNCGSEEHRRSLPSYVKPSGLGKADGLTDRTTTISGRR